MTKRVLSVVIQYQTLLIQELSNVKGGNEGTSSWRPGYKNRCLQHCSQISLLPVPSGAFLESPGNFSDLR